MATIEMDSSTPLSFDELRTTRSELRDYLAQHHAPAIEAFQVQGPLPYEGYSRSATCLESLRSAHLAIQECIQFAVDALESDKPWRSDGAAYVYCAVRTLPVVLRYLQDAQFNDRIRGFIALIWGSVSDKPNRQGIRELTGKLEGWPSLKASTKSQSVDETPGASYPPNTYQTFWGLRTLEEYRSYARVRGAPPLDDEVMRKAALSWQWARGVLALQTALFAANATSFDGDQLGWALAIRLRWDAGRFAGRVTSGSDEAIISPPPAEEQDLLRAGLNAYFRTQLPNGRWPHFGPLFHYPSSGNAYCYFFETLAEMLRPALRRDAEALRLLLRPHLAGLLKAWRYARETSILGAGNHPTWNSGHHPQRVAPESWATASVYLFLQNLRKLVGVETAARAKQDLRVVHVSEKEAQKLAQRGDTWRPDSQTNGPDLADLLATLFVHPANANKINDPREHLDPDAHVFAQPKERPGRDWARGAMLFGPPGTSKTSLVGAIAASIGWPLIEVHASHFLQDGLDRIPARADWIFARLMELDRCVVLFDELDELLRDRTNDETDPFGRFLTTLMLPKLAELWKQRRLIYFLNTNLIGNADAAIRRSERFDANILVETPSLAVKKKQLEPLRLDDPLTKEEKDLLGLVRFDQIATLRHHLNSSKTLVTALRLMFPSRKKAIKDLAKMRREVQRDYRAARVVVLRWPPNAEASTSLQVGDMALILYAQSTQDAYYYLEAGELPDAFRLGSVEFVRDAIRPGFMVGQTVSSAPAVPRAARKRGG
ncbi:MAG TPA: ATP-binding protein, partial [Terriglobales bacterium]